MALTATDEIDIEAPGADSADLTTALAAITGTKLVAAGGAVSAGPNLIGGDPNNVIASDLGSCTIAGGGRSGWNNAIGGNNANINTSTPNTVSTGTGSDYSTILGGYDNIASGQMATISGAHNYTAQASTHATILGGSLNEILSGDYNVVAGGQLNEITEGDYCAITGGGGSTINLPNNHTGAFIGGGFQNSVTAQYGAIEGGYQCSVTVEYGAVVGGRANSATAQAAIASGYGAVARFPGGHAQAGGFFSAAGDAQTESFVMRRQTTNATVSELRLNSTVGARAILPLDSVHAFHVLVAARNTASDSERAAYEIKGCISVSAAGVAAIVGSPTVTVLAEDVAGWDCTVAADSVNRALQINVTGEAAKTINWVADVRMVTVIG